MITVILFISIFLCGVEMPLHGMHRSIVLRTNPLLTHSLTIQQPKHYPTHSLVDNDIEVIAAKEDYCTLQTLFTECNTLPEFFHRKNHVAETNPYRKKSFLDFLDIYSLAQKIAQQYSTEYSNESMWLYHDESSPLRSLTKYPLSLATIRQDILTKLNNEQLPRYNTAPLPFVQRIKCLAGDKFINIGDLHGSLHSLVRILSLLYAKNYIFDDFTLAENTYLIFNGDFVDRGCYGTETLYIALLLKLKNPHNVFLLAGNHESIYLNDQAEGLSQEFNEKYPQKTPPDEPNLLQRLFRYFPLALYAEVESTSGTIYRLQYSHGGFLKTFRPYENFLYDTDKYFYACPSNAPYYTNILNWGDISFNAQTQSFSCINRMPQGSPDEELLELFRQENTANVLDFFHTEAYGIHALIRGHQDTLFSCKVPLMPGANTLHARQSLTQLKDVLDATKSLTTNQKYHSFVTNFKNTLDALYQDCCIKPSLYYWKDAPRAASYFTLENLAAPIATCSSATESQCVTSSNCLIVHTTDEHISSWHFQPLEINYLQKRLKWIKWKTSKQSNLSRLLN